MPEQNLTEAEQSALQRAEAPGVNPGLQEELPADLAEKAVRKSETSYDQRRGLVAQAVQTIGRAFRGNNKGSN